MTSALTCNCCNENEAVGVASSSLGPVSFAYCRRCLDEDADCEVMFQVMADMVNGDDTGLADYVKRMKTFKNGSYITWSDWLKTYEPSPSPVE